MNNKKLQIVGFLALLLLVFIWVLVMFKPFLDILALGIILAILFQPLYQKFLRKLQTRGRAAAATLVVMTLIILIPLGLFGELLFNELLDVYHEFRMGEFGLSTQQIIHNLPLPLQGLAQSLATDAGSKLGQLTANAFQAFSSLVSNVAGFFVALFLLFFTAYYVLKDGDKIIQILKDISPIASQQEHILFKKIVSAINGVVKGAFVVALIQGMVAVVGFFLFGVPNPLLWGMATVLAALVPTIGTSLSLIPAVLYLFLTNHTGAAIGLTIWGIFAVGLIDNVVSPRLIGSRVQLHPLLVLFSVVGGLQLFGFLGFLLGPILMAIFAALVDMYRTDFKLYLEQ